MAARTSLLGGGGSRALDALCRGTLSSADFRSALRAPLRRVLDFDAYCVNTCDVETGIITSSVGDGLTPEHARQLFALEAEGKDFNHLTELHRGPRRLASLWASTGGQLGRSPRMRHIFSPLGFGDELRAALAVGETCYGYLHLFRRVARGPFQPIELKRLEASVPAIAAALGRATARDAAASNEATPPKQGLLILDRRNRVVRHSTDAPVTVAGLDRVSIGSGAAHVLHDLVSRARVGATATATLVGGGESRLSAVQLGAQTAVMIAPWGTEHGRAWLASSAGLTPRERQVSARIAHGDSNSAIAAELRISVHTVKDHVKAILVKTRCESRAELAARWNGARR